jgi:predicted ester cyclase
MATNDNKDLIRRFFDEVFNSGNLATVDELWIAGREADGKRATMNLRTAFPDYQRTIEQQMAEGDLVTTRWTARGTHRGPYFSAALGRSIPPTGKAVTTTGISIHQVVDGRIVAAWVMGNDSLELLQQLGAIPAAEAAVTAGS